MTKITLNTPAPDFTLSDVNGSDVSLADFTDKKNVLIVFTRGFL